MDTGSGLQGLFDMFGYIIPFVLVLSVLVFIHEFGHYWVAKQCGVFVETFSIGFGSEIYGWYDKSGTRWKIAMIPLGGYVKMFGDKDEASGSDERVKATLKQEREGAAVSENIETAPSLPIGATLTPEERAKSLHFKPLHQRAAIVAAGPAANFLFSILALTLLFITVGRETTPPIVGEVLKDSVAESAGFQVDDEILSINGLKIKRFEQIRSTVSLTLGEELTFEIVRGGSVITVPLRPEIVEVKDNFGNKGRIGRLGIAASSERVTEKMPPWKAVPAAVVETWNISASIAKAIGQFFTGSRSTEELGGPIRIAQMSGEVAKHGIQSVIQFMVVLSVNLGLINLLPIPMLDGGHLLLYAIEGLRGGKPVHEDVQEVGFKLGAALLMTFMVFVFWNDLSNLKVFDGIMNFVQKLGA